MELFFTVQWGRYSPPFSSIWFWWVKAGTLTRIISLVSMLILMLPGWVPLGFDPQ